MSSTVKKALGCYYAEFAEENSGMQWGKGYVQIHIKRSTEWSYAERGWARRMSAADIADLVDQRYGGDYEMYLGAREGEKRRVEVFIQRCEREHPILKKLGPPDSNHQTYYLWMILPDDEHDREAQYQQLRNEAWAIWKNIPNLAKECRVEIERLTVRPLPGPWRLRFL